MQSVCREYDAPVPVQLYSLERHSVQTRNGLLLLFGVLIFGHCSRADRNTRDPPSQSNTMYNCTLTNVKANHSSPIHEMYELASYSMCCPPVYLLPIRTPDRYLGNRGNADNRIRPSRSALERADRCSEGTELLSK